MPTAHDPEARPVSLGMYDFGPLAAANDALWSAIAQALRAAGVPGVPRQLDRARPLEAIWTDPRLLLAQTCGWPLATTLAGRVALVATPCYALPGCEGPTHRAYIIVRRDDPARVLADLRGRHLALNGWDSNSGMNLLRATIAPLHQGGRFFGGITVTGSHVASLAAVAEGRADVASIDCVTFGLLRRYCPETVARLRALAETPSSPALPFITRRDAPAAEIAALRDALQAVLAHPAARELALAGFEVLPLAAYQTLPEMASSAECAGYGALS